MTTSDGDDRVEGRPGSTNRAQMLPPSIRVAGGALAVWHRPKLRLVKKLRDEGITTIVTLLMESEGAPAIGRACAEAGIGWIWVPLDGAGIPDVAHTAELMNRVEEVAARVSAGAHVLVHCSAGIHRTGLFTYALLRRLGLDRSAAADMLHASRPTTADGVGAERLQWGNLHFGDR
jgi:DNA-binding Lrp family transcriptional regulator